MMLFKLCIYVQSYCTPPIKDTLPSCSCQVVIQKLLTMSVIIFFEIITGQSIITTKVFLRKTESYTKKRPFFTQVVILINMVINLGKKN